MPRSKQKSCSHTRLLTTPSPHAEEVGYKRFTAQQLFTAATGSRKRVSRGYEEYSGLFPAPLVLPGDELVHDPKCPPQSFKSWLNEPARNEITQRRKTVYVAAPPHLKEEMAGVMRDWTAPLGEALLTPKQGLVQQPAIDGVLSYLSAFFHGLPVKMLDDQLEWSAWSEDSKQKTGRKTDPSAGHSAPRSIGLSSQKLKTTTRIRVRHLERNDHFSGYRQQLSLDDILDHAIAILPEDAYCLILLVDHDLYEDDDDDFCCGRAYGGSRICVVSSAQYQPALDAWHSGDIMDGHFWPASHRADFVEVACAGYPRTASSKKRKTATHREGKQSDEKRRGNGRSASDAIMIDSSIVEDEANYDHLTPLEVAVAAQSTCLKQRGLSEVELGPLYLRRLSLTASHELLHCFGLDHCVYYACAMQSTASMVEDSRQPPYLCPVCENKLARAVSNIRMQEAHAKSSSNDWWQASGIVDWRKTRNQAILAFCEARGKDDLGFASLGAWTRRALEVGGEML